MVRRRVIYKRGLQGGPYPLIGGGVTLGAALTGLAIVGAAVLVAYAYW